MEGLGVREEDPNKKFPSLCGRDQGRGVPVEMNALLGQHPWNP